MLTVRKIIVNGLMLIRIIVVLLVMLPVIIPVLIGNLPYILKSPLQRFGKWFFRLPVVGLQML
jgi:hypothetical protein